MRIIIEINKPVIHVKVRCGFHVSFFGVKTCQYVFLGTKGVKRVLLEYTLSP